MTNRGPSRKSASPRVARSNRAIISADPRQALHTDREMARAYFKHLNHDAAVSLSRAVTYRVVEAWWNSLANPGKVALRELMQPVVLPPVSETLDALARSIGAGAANLPADEAIYQIGLTYTAMLPDEFRTKHGVYYTPPPLAERLLDQATAAGLDWKTCSVLDPACGGGAFLAPVVKRVLASLSHCEPAVATRAVGSRIAGYELDPFAAWLSQVGVDSILLPMAKPGQTLPVVVSICDTLTKTAPKRKFDLVIGNPPYGRVRLDTSARREFAHVLYGHANLYALFMDIALRHTKSKGLLGYLTPTSFLAGQYFKSLRGHLFKNAPPISLDLVAVRKGVFEEVLQEVLLATYRRGSTRRTASIHLAEPQSITELKVTAAGTLRLPDDGSQPWLMPRSAKEGDIFERLQHLSAKLEDWGYTVSTGPLVWNRHKSQLTDDFARNCLPLIWAEAITPDGRFIWRADKKNHTRYFRVQEGDDWLITRSPCVLLQRTTAKEQARRLIATAIPDNFINSHKAIVIENHLNMLKPIRNKSVVSPATLAAFLNSGAADRIFRCISGSVAVSAYELEAMPLPSPDQLSVLTQLTMSGASKVKIDDECARLVFGDSNA